MPEFSQSAKLYQERRLPCDQNTRRLPGMRISPDTLPVHSILVSRPYPSTEMILQAVQPPDAGHTGLWPYGDGPAAEAS